MPYWLKELLGYSALALIGILLLFLFIMDFIKKFWRPK